MDKLKKTPLLSSLNGKMLFRIVIGALAAVMLYFIVIAVGGFCVRHFYMSQDAVAARKAKIYSRFNSYVQQYDIAGTDEVAVASWTLRNDYVTILVYKGDRLSMRAHSGTAEISPSMNSNELMYTSEFGKLYPMRFADGLYRIAIDDSSQTRQYLIVEITALISAGLMFAALILLYTRKLTRRIIRLSADTVEVSRGALDKALSAEGGDEISVLAGEIDNMRSSIIERMGAESRAWQANSELLTAISHDIRTPMTTLLGYLGLLNESDFSDVERCRQFSDAAYRKALELKDLTDELFKYFLAFGRAELDVKLEELDATLLFEQLLGEAEYELREQGFSVDYISFEGEAKVMADPLYLKRVIDNMLSNIKKYADPSRAVVFISEQKDGIISVCLSNSIKPNLDRVESTKIGMRTCEKIMSAMKGEFITVSDDEHFSAEIRLPVA